MSRSSREDICVVICHFGQPEVREADMSCPVGLLDIQQSYEHFEIFEDTVICLGPERNRTLTLV
jgi:hypothetical protein